MNNFIRRWPDIIFWFWWPIMGSPWTNLVIMEDNIIWSTCI